MRVAADFDNLKPREGILLSSQGGYDGIRGNYRVLVGYGEVVDDLRENSLTYLRSDNGQVGPAAITLLREKKRVRAAAEAAEAARKAAEDEPESWDDADDAGAGEELDSWDVDDEDDKPAAADEEARGKSVFSKAQLLGFKDGLQPTEEVRRPLPAPPRAARHCE